MNQGNTNVDVGQPGFTLPDTTFSIQNTPTAVNQILTVDFETVYPNPFSDDLKITYQSRAHSSDVRFAVYNLYGQCVRELYTESVPTGVSTMMWDGRTNHGDKAASGAYLLIIEDGERLVTFVIKQ